MGDVTDFQRTDCWCTFSWSIRNRKSHFIRCIQSPFPGLWWHIQITAEASSAKRNSDQKLKLSEMKGIVSINRRSTAAEVTVEINIHFEAVATKTVWQELHKTNIHGTAAIVEPLITENSAKRWSRWCDDHKSWPSDEWKYIIWSDELSFTLLSSSCRVYVWTLPKEAYNPECLVPTVKHGARSVMIWAAVSSILLVLYLLRMVELLPVTTWTF